MILDEIIHGEKESADIQCKRFKCVFNNMRCKMRSGYHDPDCDLFWQVMFDMK